MKKYKQVLTQQKEVFNEIYKKVSNPNKTNAENAQITINAMASGLARMYEDKHMRESLYMAVATKGLVDELNNKIIHYFIKDNSLIDFLKNTEIKDVSIVKEYIAENKSALDVIADYYSIALHTENEGLFITYLQREETTNVVVFTNKNALTFPLSMTKKVTDPAARLAVNLIYYIKAFPEKILNGVPDDMVKNDKKKLSKMKNCTIGIADEIVEKTEVINGHIVTPHFRSGFFRHYSDDRYINMKGKVQFIAATMVKGKAKTIVA